MIRVSVWMLCEGLAPCGGSGAVKLRALQATPRRLRAPWNTQGAASLPREARHVGRPPGMREPAQCIPQ